MIHPLTPETAVAERRRLLSEVRHHRRIAAQRLRDLDRLEADCARVGIRLIREDVRAERAETDGNGTDPQSR